MRENFVLIAEDDIEDQEIIKDAFSEIDLATHVEFVTDGEALIEALEERNNSEIVQPLPDLIFLDLNMPKKNGFEVLNYLRMHTIFRQIPVVVFTTSQAEDDILEVYKLGANSFIHKPSTFRETVTVLSDSLVYWFQLVHLPQVKKTCHRSAIA